MAYLMMENLVCGYKNRIVLTVDSLQMERGDALTVVGPNGSGKSTLLKSLAGLIPVNSGKFIVDGKNIVGLPPESRAQKIAMLVQIQSLDPGLTVKDLVALGRTPYLPMFGTLSKEDNVQIESAISICDLEQLSNVKLGQISGGERQRARLAMVLAQQTPILFLDEPTNHMDVKHRYMLYKIIKEIREKRKTIVIMVSHSLEDSTRFAEKTMLVDDATCTIYKQSDFNKLKSRIVDKSNVPATWVY